MDEIENRLKHIEIKVDELLRNRRVLAEEMVDAHNLDGEMDVQPYKDKMAESVMQYKHEIKYHRPRQ